MDFKLYGEFPLISSILVKFKKRKIPPFSRIFCGTSLHIIGFPAQFQTTERAIYENSQGLQSFFPDFFKVVSELFRYFLGIIFCLEAQFVDILSAHKVDKLSLESKSAVKFWPSDIFHHFIDPSRSSHLGFRWKPFERTTRLLMVV